MLLESDLKYRLKLLASRYENKEFLIGDPSWFMHQIEGNTNKELLAFIASSLSYGSRKQFLPKIQYILDNVNNNVAEWLMSGAYKLSIPHNKDCFYRLYTNQTFNDFLCALAGIVHDYGSLKELLIKHMKSDHALEAIAIINTEFVHRGSVGVIPKLPVVENSSCELKLSGASSCKRVCMFLRWMVRDNSPVDLGLWSDIIDKRTLIIPMDTHVMQEASSMGLIKSKTASMATALKLSSKLRDVFPNDPLKGDFALFGLGVDEK